MNAVEYFIWLTGQTISVLLYFWPVTLLLGAAVVFTTIRVTLRSMLFPKALAWSLLPSVVPVAILLWGVVFERQGPGVLVRLLSWEMAPILTLIAMSIAVGAYATWKAMGCRWMVASTSAMFVWFSLAAGFLSGMSVTGDWL